MRLWCTKVKRWFSKILGRKAMSVQTEVESARRFGAQPEELVVRRGQCPDDDRNILLMGYWALIFDYHKGILSLISNGFCGSAFALVRPVVEALVRWHVAVKGSTDDVQGLQQDVYRVNFATIGPWVDAEFGLGNFFTRLLTRARDALHSYTHAGVSQLARRFDGRDLKPRYEDDEIIEVIRSCTSAAWMVTNLVTKHLHFDEEAEEAQELFLEWVGTEDNGRAASRRVQIKGGMGVSQPSQRRRASERHF
jgi:hypothetical protein